MSLPVHALVAIAGAQAGAGIRRDTGADRVLDSFARFQENLDRNPAVSGIVRIRKDLNAAEVTAAGEVSISLGQIPVVEGGSTFELQVGIDERRLEKVLFLVDIADLVPRAAVKIQFDVGATALRPYVQAAFGKRRFDVTAIGREDLQASLEIVVGSVPQARAGLQRYGVGQNVESRVFCCLAFDGDVHLPQCHGLARIDRQRCPPAFVVKIQRRFDAWVVKAVGFQRSPRFRNQGPVTASNRPRFGVAGFGGQGRVGAHVAFDCPVHAGNRQLGGNQCGEQPQWRDYREVMRTWRHGRFLAS